MYLLQKILDRITNFIAALAGIAAVLMMIHITISIITRFFFNYALPGTMTIVSNYYMVIIVCLPLAFVERSNAHIAVDVFTNQIPKSIQKKLFGWTYLFSAVIFGLICYGSWIEAIQKFAIGQISVEQDLTIPTWIGYFAVPFGYGMVTLYTLMKFFQFLLNHISNSPDDDTDHLVERLSHD